MANNPVIELIIKNARNHATRLTPWFSSFGSDFNFDLGMTVGENESSGTSVFLRDDDAVCRTYFTTARGDEMLGSFWSFLDLTPLGRQETWEDSPEGWPQTEPYEWWRQPR